MIEAFAAQATVADRPSVKGWCPGALRPMASGDGLVVRVRARGGALPLATLDALADIAARFGNGHIDVTRRANLQLRGVSEATLPFVLDALQALGLIDASPEAEAVRNIMVSPLAGLDPGAADVRPIARELETILAGDAALHALPGKFGFVVDGGGALPLSGEMADVAIRVGAGAGAAEIGIARCDGWRWLGRVLLPDAADAARRVALSFLRTRAPGPRGRMRDATASQVDAVVAAVQPVLLPAREGATAPVAPRAGTRIGVSAFAGDAHVIGVGAPFGRVEAAALAALARDLALAGADDVRLSPWRALHARVRDAAAAHAVLAAAARLGFIVDDGDALLGIEACPGAPDCPQARGDTRRIARRLAAASGTRDLAGPIHVSGCAKGCARSAAAALTLVADGARYLAIRDGTASDAPAASFTADEIEAAPDRLLALASAASAT